MDLQVDETVAVIAHQALMLHRALSADQKPEPKLVLGHIQRMQGMVLTWVQQAMPQEAKVEPEPPADAKKVDTINADLAVKPLKNQRKPNRKAA